MSGPDFEPSDLESIENIIDAANRTMAFGEIVDAGFAGMTLAVSTLLADGEYISIEKAEQLLNIQFQWGEFASKLTQLDLEQALELHRRASQAIVDGVVPPTFNPNLLLENLPE